MISRFVISRFVLAVALAAVMVVVGTSTFLYLGTRQSKVAAPIQKPTTVTPRPGALVLPGTLYMSQQGAIYALSSGRFHQLTPESGWIMPALFPSGNYLLAVKSGSYWSDVYVLNLYGTPEQKLTSNLARTGMLDPSLDHWSFYPRLSADGQTLWMTYDGLKCDGCYDVSPAIYSMPYGGTIRQAVPWTDGGYYSGGDQEPLPVANGVIYTKYDYADTYDANAPHKLVGMLWFTSRRGARGVELTPPTADCRTPAFNYNGTELAMVCTYMQQVSYLTIATWNGATLGPLQTLVKDQNPIVAQPTWAPDGSGIAYMAPAIPGGPFQLWWLPKAAYTAPPPAPVPTPTPGGPHNGPLPSPTPAPPPPPVKAIEVTTNNGFDATSPMAWAS